MRESVFDALNRILPGGITLPEFTGMLAQGMWCQRLKHTDPLFRQVARVLYDHDLEGIYLSGENAYHSEATGIVLRLRDCRSVEEVQKLVAKEFSRAGFDGSNPERFKDIAIALYNLISF